MNRKVMGLLVGVGVGIGTVTSLIVLFLRGEKPRRFMRNRFKRLRRALPKPAQVQHYAQQATARVAQLAGSAKDTTQQAMKKVKDTGSDLGEKIKHLTPV